MALLETTRTVPIYRTKTFLSLCLIELGNFLPRYAFFLASPDTLQIISDLMEAAGGLGVLWGRLAARKQATVIPGPTSTDEIKTSGTEPPTSHHGG